MYIIFIKAKNRKSTDIEANRDNGDNDNNEDNDGLYNKIIFKYSALIIFLNFYF